MTDQLTLAENERDRSRQRFRASFAAARARLNPAQLRAEGSDRARAAVSALPAKAMEAARDRPRLAAGIVSGLAFLLLRKPIFAAYRRLTKENDDG